MPLTDFDLEKIPDTGSILVVGAARIRRDQFVSELLKVKHHLPVLSPDEIDWKKRPLKACVVLQDLPTVPARHILMHPRSTGVLVVLSIDPSVRLPPTLIACMDFIVLFSDVPDKMRDRIFDMYGIYFATATNADTAAVVLDRTWVAETETTAYVWTPTREQ